MNKVTSLNDEQALAVSSRNSSILVSAPAGSGKTKILVNRIISLIEEDRYNINELLVLTFTKAAALEMKQRLLESLDQELSNDDLSEDLLNHLLLQKQLINDAYITNFHSFCSDLLSQYGSIIGISNKFEIIENPENIKNDIFNQCLNDWVANSRFQDFFKNNYVDYNFNELKSMIFKLDSISTTIYDFDNYIKNIQDTVYNRIIKNHSFTGTPFEKAIMNQLERSYDAGINNFNKLTVFANNNCLDFYQTDAKSISPYKAIDDYYKSIRQYLDMGIDSIVQNGDLTVDKHRSADFKNLDVDDSVKTEYSNLLKKAKTRFLDDFKKIVCQDFDNISACLELSNHNINYLLELLDEFQNKYNDYKNSIDVLDFNDLEKYALQLLDPINNVSDSLYHQIKEIMIDEYQDTNEIQETLINKIAQIHEPYINCFMVGDMKQSIYRFRKADLDIFNNKYLNFSINDENVKHTKTRRIDLLFNYRSNKIVLDSINYIFNQIMDTSYGGIEYYKDPSAKLNYDYLRKEGCQTLDDYPSVKEEAIKRLNEEKRFNTDIMLVLKSEDRSKDMVEYEAKMTVKKINELIGHLDLDFYQKPTRKAQYQDIAILMRNVSNFITYKKVFDQYQIPNLILLTKGFFMANEIISCVSFLKAINNCFDDISFTSVLKGNYEFSNFSEDTIYTIKQKDTSIYDSLLSSDDFKIQLFIEYYHNMVSYSKEHYPYEVLEKFIKDSKYRTFVSSLYNGKQRQANIDLLIEMLKQDKHLSLNELITKIDQTIDNDIDYKPATISSNNSNVVTFMTIHKSKGLEFPIIILNQLQHQFNFADSSAKLVNDKELGISLNPRRSENIGIYRDVITERVSPIKGIMAARLNDETINEEMRILYVALTRASQKIIMTGVIKDINQVITWQNNMIDNTESCFHKDNDIIIYDNLRDVKCYLDWIGLSIVRHPDFINQCYDLSFIDTKITNRMDLSVIKDNARKLNLYNKHLFEDNTMHSKYFTQIIDTDTIDESIIVSNKYDVKVDYQKYQQFNNFVYDNNNLTRTIAVTKIINDNNRNFEHLDNDNTDTNIKATDRGTIIHRIMELLPLDKNMDLNNVLNIIVKDEGYDDDIQLLIKEYQNHIQDFINSDVFDLMINTKHLYKEKKFSFKDENQQIIHGIFDVVCNDEDKITIIDYKTDNLSINTSEEVLKESHQEQMNYYKKILARVFPQANIQAIVFYLKINKYVIL